MGGRLGEPLLFTPCGRDDPSTETMEVDERDAGVRSVL